MTTLTSRIEQSALGQGFGGPGGTVTFVDGDDHDTITWADLHADATSMAAAMQARGVRLGDNIAILGPTTRPLVTAIEATWLCGACLVMLPLPMRMGSIDGFISQTRDRMSAADISMLLIDGQFSEFIAPVEGDPPFVSFDEVLPADASARFPKSAYVRPDIDPDDVAVLQFTSGSTSHPKGVMLPHRQICANLDGAIVAADIRPDDVVVSWLPLYHDMGLIGLLTIPLITGISLVVGAPQDFLAKPVRWMQWISDYRGTLTAGPNFSWVLATRALRRAEDLDLSQMRIALSGAEPVDPESFRHFLDEATRFGLPPECLFPAFGMAEVCIAGVFPPQGSGMRTDVIDGRVLEHEHFAASVEPGSPNARELAILGRAIPGLQIRIIDPATRVECREREVGELLIRGTSVTTGYYNRPDATEKAFNDGWYLTGDYGYTLNGEVFVAGRKKDMIIVGGKNVYPQDLETLAYEVPGIHAGRAVAFGIYDEKAGTEEVVIVAEVDVDGEDERQGIADALRQHITKNSAVALRHAYIVGRQWIVKTSSGKTARSANREKFLKEMGLI